MEIPMNLIFVFYFVFLLDMGEKKLSEGKLAVLVCHVLRSHILHCIVRMMHLDQNKLQYQKNIFFKLMSDQKGKKVIFRDKK